MNIEDAAGAFLILLPIAFNAFFFALGRLFDYPDNPAQPVGGHPGPPFAAGPLAVLFGARHEGRVCGVEQPHRISRCYRGCADGMRVAYSRPCGEARGSDPTSLRQ